MDELDTQWYWDQRNRKAYYPVAADDDTVTFVTRWHREEVADALDGGALGPLDAIGIDRTDTTLDRIDSFRALDSDELDGYRAVSDD